jgi:hypothetical protein
MTVPFLTLVLALPSAPAPKIERPEAGKLPPRVVWITPAREGKFEMVDTKQEMLPTQKTVTVQEDGQVRRVTQTVMVAVPRTVVRNLDIESVQFYGLDGKKIESKEVRKLLTKDMPALLSVDGKPVDRFYLRLAREGTLVLVVPPSADRPWGEAKPAPGQKLPPQPKPVERKEEAVPVRKLPPE